VSGRLSGAQRSYLAQPPIAKDGRRDCPGSPRAPRLCVGADQRGVPSNWFTRCIKLTTDEGYEAARTTLDACHGPVPRCHWRSLAHT